MQDLLTVFGEWTWWVISGVLLLLELALPGVFFIWLAFAAAAVGLLVLVRDLTWQAQIIIFAALSVAFVLIARPWLRKGELVDSDRPNLNRRMQSFVGRSFVLDQPIANGRGRLSIDGTLWEIEGPDQPRGEWVRVKSVDDMRLVVEPIAKPT
jgi:inner membrane protein